MWIYYNPNPVTDRGMDCAVRAIAKALDTTWESAYAMLASNGFAMGDVMNGNHVIGSVLRQHGFTRTTLPDTCPDCYTAEDFCNDHPSGMYVLGFGDHIATAIDGIIYDAWNSSGKIPIYYWRKKEEKTEEKG